MKKLSFLKKLFTLLKVVVLTGVFIILSSFGVFFYYVHDLPQPEKFTEISVSQSTKIYDRTGKILLYEVYGEVKRELVSFEKISQHLKNAILAVEDSKFYQHQGIDLKAIGRAILVDLKLKKPAQGASTLTQQLIRNVYLKRQKTVIRKMREVLLSIELERRYSKDQIFEWYLNTVPFGENTYGAEAASQVYFNKPAADLSLNESAVLAALLAAPSYYSPYGPNKDKLLERKNYVLERMKKLGYITEEEFNKAKEDKINFTESRIFIRAPHFVFYIKKYLENKYGEDYLKEKGLRVYTTLDWEIQQYVEQVVKERDEINKKKNVHNTAVVVLNVKNGEILALIGSKDFFANSYPEGCEEKPGSKCLFNPKYDVATMGERHPGSAFKPIVYATAFKKGFTPETIVWDVKTEFNPYCNPNANDYLDKYGQKCYHPQNYDGKYRGPVKLKQALGSSLNIPSVKVLYLAGIKESLQTARDLGLTTLTREEEYGLSLVLGGGEVNLLELANAYGVFARDGLYLPASSILKIEDSKGNLIEEKKNTPRRVLNSQIARQINDILSDDKNRTLVFGAHSILEIPGFQVAVKTGTTQNFIDGWTIGYTPNMLVGVWTGNNDNSPTWDSGIGVAAPIWRKITEKIITSQPIEYFPKPALIESINPILLGQLPENEFYTILHYINKDNPLGPPPEDPKQDPQYMLWQIGINYWLLQTNKYAP